MRAGGGGGSVPAPRDLLEVAVGGTKVVVVQVLGKLVRVPHGVVQLEAAVRVVLLDRVVRQVRELVVDRTRRVRPRRKPEVGVLVEPRTQRGRKRGNHDPLPNVELSVIDDHGTLDVLLDHVPVANQVVSRRHGGPLAGRIAALILRGLQRLLGGESLRGERVRSKDRVGVAQNAKRRAAGEFQNLSEIPDHPYSPSSVRV
mmetsp:Transcript_9773/g.24137  ORF Transcript_9773/g.24137 Transcript_9773/m.24137 type:complete len:201 (-) Transcript_9773:155-757(-)